MTFGLIALLIVVFPPFLTTHASFFSVVGNILTPVGETADAAPAKNSQTLALLETTGAIDPKKAASESDVTINDNALVPDIGPLGTSADIAPGTDNIDADAISLYVVLPGDTLSSIANMYDVSVNTIRWANNIEAGKSISVGQTLVILPISGVKYTVTKKGETVSGIAKKFSADSKEIQVFNGITSDSILAIGDTLIIPDGEVAPATPAKKPTSTSKVVPGYSGPSVEGYYGMPIHGIITQGIHGHNGVDVGAPTGSAVYAAAEGTVIIAKGSGWNGGYGEMIGIAHSNGTQTIYGHLSQVNVSVGQHVQKGDGIGRSGNTGDSSGPHLHFEIRGAKNILGAYRMGGRI